MSRHRAAALGDGMIYKCTEDHQTVVCSGGRCQTRSTVAADELAPADLSGGNRRRGARPDHDRVVVQFAYRALGRAVTIGSGTAGSGLNRRQHLRTAASARYRRGTGQTRKPSRRVAAISAPLQHQLPGAAEISRGGLKRRPADPAAHDCPNGQPLRLTSGCRSRSNTGFDL